MKEIDDDHIMTFGKFRGKKLGSIDAGYLLWLWDNGAYHENHDLHNYIFSAYDNLCSECTKIPLRKKNGTLNNINKHD